MNAAGRAATGVAVNDRTAADGETMTVTATTLNIANDDRAGTVLALPRLRASGGSLLSHTAALASKLIGVVAVRIEGRPRVPEGVVMTTLESPAAPLMVTLNAQPEDPLLKRGTFGFGPTEAVLRVTSSRSEPITRPRTARACATTSTSRTWRGRMLRPSATFQVAEGASS